GNGTPFASTCTATRSVRTLQGESLHSPPLTPSRPACPSILNSPPARSPGVWPISSHPKSASASTSSLLPTSTLSSPTNPPTPSSPASTTTTSTRHSSL